jgi:transmembrane sensor
MLKHDPYSLTELIRNDEFIAWVLHPNEANDLRWKRFLQDFPRKRETVSAAREYVILLAKDTGRHIPTNAQSNKMWQVVESRIHNENADQTD